ncbi:hypothetical protein [Streptomyces sp. NBC_01363]|uniref:hypothetical protein n=1 Tax=Streptomyces sp. NBC_01363 TaxID=2903840 RepID=UPI00225606A1|nr:hypothetical protein [Streptomyces sp. NBC_01363]MCX4736822.1 hypothetical protein [Streptomyces sp. NBC_01363]
MLDHIADAMKEPDVVRLDRNVYVLRFEMMKLYSALEAVFASVPGTTPTPSHNEEVLL